MKSLKKHIILTAGLMAASLSGFAEKESVVTPVVVDELVQPYLEVQSSLAGDNLAAAKAGAQTLLSTLAAGPQAESLDQLQAAAGTLAKSEDIKAARAAFLDLSNVMIELAKTTGTSGEPTLHVAHCPMAFEGKGADWIQSDKTISNPYYGAAMRRCGDIKEQISGSKEQAHPTHRPLKENLPHAHGSTNSPHNADPYSFENLDAVHAGVPGYAAAAQLGSSGTNKPDSDDCQMACCQSKGQ